MAFRHKAKTNKQKQPTIHNPREPRKQRETYMDLMYMGKIKREALLSKLGAWGPWERVEGEGRGREKMEKNI